MNTDFEILKITEDEFAAVKIANSADRPNAMSTYGGAKKSPADVKRMFDKAPELLVGKHNALVEAVISKKNALDAAETGRESAEAERKNAEHERQMSEESRNEAEANREQAREAFENDVNARLDNQDAKLSGRLGEGGGVTLLASEWTSDNAQTVTVAGLREEDIVIFYPATADDREYCGYYGVFVSPESEDGAFTVTARAKPAADITLRYYVIRGKLPEEVS